MDTSTSHIRVFRNGDTSVICSWVKTAADLLLISGNYAPQLTPDILQQWVEKADEAFVLEHDYAVRGFTTLGTTEWTFPEKTVEVGHLVIDPAHRHHGFGLLLLHEVTEIARKSYERVVGRIVPTNMEIRQLLDKASWVDITGSETWNTNTPFCWYQAADSQS